MSGGWTRKRFWDSATVAEASGGYLIELDGRRVNTPAKRPLLVPTRRMATMIAGEWAAQKETIAPLTMPVTRSANAAIDKVAVQHGEVAALIAAYGDADLLCYRAEAPEELVRRQSEAWDPPLFWAAETLGAALEPRTGVIHAPQPRAALDALSGRVHGYDAFRLAALHDLVSLTGSLVLGLAAALGWREADDVWRRSLVDEHWQQAQWGTDSEETAREAMREAAFRHARDFFDMC
ncbi:ATP12 family chaperone protein [Pontibaca methylaminivorans]|uniref:ATP12 family chaperone protein n=1 Tax=Pontibaca methylaminivorans TaxID=515897 RepID=UPI002FD937F2